jgi:hypothetical protein
MKKIFTLIAVAAMALSVNAQEKLIFSATETYADNQELTTASTTLKLGNDQNPGTFKIGQSALDAEVNAYLADFFQTITTDDGEKNGVVTINGGNNPKDKTGKNSGSGFNAAEGKTTGNLPQSGTYFVLNTTAAGKVQMGIVLNAGKAFYLIDATNAAPDETGDYLQVALPESNLKNYTLMNGAGEVVEATPASDDKGGMEVADKLMGTLEFNAEANHTYYVFCTGSKLGCFGYIFTAGASDGIETVKATTKDAVRYNLAGQKVSDSFKGIAIQNGKKIVIK